MHQMTQISGIVTVEPDGRTAKGRWWGFGPMAIPAGSMEIPGGESVDQTIACDIYQIGYIKVDDVSKIMSIKWTIPFGVRISESWSLPEDISAPFVNGEFKGPVPDIPVDPADLHYVTGHIFPFHYKHPVTGKETSEGERKALLRK